MLTIFEPHCSGHRMRYVRWIAREAVARGHSVRLVTFDSSLQHPMYLGMQEECGERLRTMLLPDIGDLQTEELLNRGGNPLILAKRELLYYRLFSAGFRQVSRNGEPGFVFVPWLDYCIHVIGLIGSPFGEAPWGGIALRPSFHYESMGIRGPQSSLAPVKSRLIARLLDDKRLRVLFTIDEMLMHYARRRDQRLGKKLRFLPDPAEFSCKQDRRLARRRLDIAENETVLLVYGALSLRKGIDVLLRATQDGHFPSELTILLAGVQDPEVESLLASSRAKALRSAGRLREINSFLTEEDECAAFSAADIVWLGYREHYTMSGVLVQAGIMGLPVIAGVDGLMGWFAREHRLGLSVELDDISALAGAISQLVRDREFAAELGRNGRNTFSGNTPKNFARAIVDNTLAP